MKDHKVPRDLGMRKTLLSYIRSLDSPQIGEAAGKKNGKRVQRKSCSKTQQTDCNLSEILTM